MKIKVKKNMLSCTVKKMCQKNRHNYVSFDIDTNCVEIFIEKKEGGTKNFIKGIEYRQKNFSFRIYGI